MPRKKARSMPTAFTIILGLLILLGIVSHLLPTAVMDGETIVDATIQISKDALTEGILFKKGKKNYLLIKIK